MGPVLFPRLWARRYAAIAAGWAMLTLTMLAVWFGAAVTTAAFLRTVLHDYLSFIALLFGLYVVAGGILVTGNLRGTPAGNTGMLFPRQFVASLFGTAGAAMIVVRPLIRANQHRPFNAHVLVFAIFLVGNLGGALTPVGNPPLFIGFLRGVDFFWPAQHLFPAVSFVAATVLLIFVAVDGWCYARERSRHASLRDSQPTVIRIRGWINVYLLCAVVAAILLSDIWKPGIVFTIGGIEVELQNLARDELIATLAIVSLKLTPVEHREANGFSWEPIREVAILFAAIFVCLIPIVAMLNAGSRGALGWLLTLTGGPDHSVAYFWLSGLLSSVLDNAPTYLLFFELAGGDPHQLMGPLAGTLAALSLGSSAMGALTYVGNAPNLMIHAIACERGIRMPSFFAFMLWSGVVLLPIFAVVGWIYFA